MGTRKTKKSDEQKIKEREKVKVAKAKEKENTKSKEENEQVHKKKTTELIDLSQRRYIHSDIFKVLPKLEEGKFDLIILDINFGNINKSNEKAKLTLDIFDEEDLKRLLRKMKKLLSDEGNLIIFSQEITTFTFYNILPELYAYSLVWKKGNKVTKHLDANKRPLVNHNDILVFQKHIPNVKHIYNPQFTKGVMRYASLKSNGYKQKEDNCYGERKPVEQDSDLRYPTTILDFQPDIEQFAPMQKPLALMDWLILTYSNKDSVILDPCMGTGTTALSAKKYNRKFIGVEKNDNMFTIAKERIKNFAVAESLL